MSLGVGWRIQEGRSDKSACLVVSPENCSHIHPSFEKLTLFEKLKPSATETTCSYVLTQLYTRISINAAANYNGDGKVAAAIPSLLVAVNTIWYLLCIVNAYH